MKDFLSSLQSFRQNAENSLQQKNSWLSVAGLHWLNEGENSFGTDPTLDIVLPPNAGPGYAGVFHLQDGQITLHPTEESLKVNGNPAGTMRIKPDSSGIPDRIELNTLSMTVIQRGEQFAIRLFDNQHPHLKNFSGLKWFPPDITYQLTARFVPHPTPKTILIQTVIGTTIQAPSPGIVVFIVAGQEYQLTAESSDLTQSLFFNFKDTTNGITTYPSGRFLHTLGVQNGTVVLDFNRARNPPCVYTDYATCPLPPPENALPIPIPAGEMKYIHPA